MPSVFAVRSKPNCPSGTAPPVPFWVNVSSSITVVEGQRRTVFGKRLGVVIHVHDRHVGEVEVVDLLARVVHDQRRTAEVLARGRQRQQRRQAWCCRG